MGISDTLLTFADLGVYLRLGRTAMHLAKRRGDLPPGFRIGRNLRWQLSTVKEWIKKREETPTIDPLYANRHTRIGKTNNENTSKKRGRPTKKEQVEGV